jgi:hypothetical protein
MTDVDWFVMIAALGAASAGVSWYGYRRWRRLVLSPADLEFAVVDPLTAAEFVRYCAALVRLLGYQRVRRARGGAVSLTATAPDGTLVAIRCAGQKDPVATDMVRGLHQGITTGGHAGRAGILVTNALVTPEARALADDAAITMADRAVLRHWMELARDGRRGGTPAWDAAARARAVDTRVMAGTVGCAALMLIAVAIHAAIGAAAPRTVAPRAAAASVAAASTPAATSASAGNPGSTGSPASRAGTASGGGSAKHEWHVLHVKHVEHMRHVEYAESHQSSH